MNAAAMERGIRRSVVFHAAIASLALAGIACAQTTAPVPKPTINALELAPEDPSPGGQFVWLYNPSATAANVGCYRLHSRNAGVTLVVSPGTRVPAHSTIVFAPSKAWLRAADRVDLLDRSGRLVQRTPLLSDQAFDGRAWFKPIGADWRFGVTQAPGKEVVRGKISTAALMSCKVN